MYGSKQNRTPFSVILWGPATTVLAVAHKQLIPLLEPAGPLGGYHKREIMAFLPNDDPLGERAKGTGNVTRAALLLSSKPMRPSMTYITCQVPWTPVIVAHLLSCIDTPREYLKIQFNFFQLATKRRQTRFGKFPATFRYDYLLCSGIVRAGREPGCSLAPPDAPTTWYHLLYLPCCAMNVEQAMNRATGMQLAARNWNVSVHLEGEVDLPAVTRFVHSATEAYRLPLAYKGAQLACLQKGLPVRRETRVPEGEEESMQAQAATEVAQNRQRVIKPAARRVGQGAGTAAEAAPMATRAARNSAEAAAAAALEQRSQGNAVRGAKPARERAEAEAKGAGKRPRVAKASARAPGALEGAASSSGGADLSFLEEGGDRQ